MNEAEELSHNTSAGIPVNNLWLLMLYASEFRYEMDGYSGSESLDEDVANLVADILCTLVELRLKRQLTYGYKHSTSDLSRVRGRINVLETYTKQLLQKGKVNCTFEELSVDTQRNRYICSALTRVAGLVSKKALKQRCRKLAEAMVERGVSPLHDLSYQPKSERFGKHELVDKKVLATAELAFNLALINETTTIKGHTSPHKQAEWVRKLFEKAVGGFYKLKLDKAWQVRTGKWLNWQVDYASSRTGELLPSMQLDVCIENSQLDKRIVIDTKYTEITTSHYFGGESFKSGYIYQLYTYLRSQEKPSDTMSLKSTGMLLHPSVGVSYDESAVIQGHEFRFCTVDLTRSSAEIATQLMGLLELR